MTLVPSKKSPGGNGPVLVLGAPPRADLLPPEVKAARRGDSIRRGLVIGVVGVVVIGIAAYAASAVQLATAQATLAGAQAKTVELRAEQLEYLPARTVKQKIQTVKNGEQVGVSTEILWKSYLNKVERSLPNNAKITTFAADATTPIEEASLPTNPLQGARIATIVFTAESDTLPDIEKWLQGLAGLPGFADANPDSVTRADGEPFVATITMHITEEAYSGRFQPEPIEDAAADAATTDDGSDD
jgi:hypothetical protein